MSFALQDNELDRRIRHEVQERKQSNSISGYSIEGRIQEATLGCSLGHLRHHAWHLGVLSGENLSEEQSVMKVTRGTIQT